MANITSTQYTITVDQTRCPIKHKDDVVVVHDRKLIQFCQYFTFDTEIFEPRNLKGYVSVKVPMLNSEKTRSVYLVWIKLKDLATSLKKTEEEVDTLIKQGSLVKDFYTLKVELSCSYTKISSGVLNNFDFDEESYLVSKHCELNAGLRLSNYLNVLRRAFQLLFVSHTKAKTTNLKLRNNIELLVIKETQNLTMLRLDDRRCILEATNHRIFIVKNLTLGIYQELKVAMIPANKTEYTVTPEAIDAIKTEFRNITKISKDRPEGIEEAPSCLFPLRLPNVTGTSWAFTTSHYAEKSDLHTFLTQHQDLALLDKIDMSQQILRAVVCLHQRKIFHSDVKPEHIQVLKRPEGDYRVFLGNHLGDIFCRTIKHVQEFNRERYTIKYCAKEDEATKNTLVEKEDIVALTELCLAQDVFATGMTISLIFTNLYPLFHFDKKHRPLLEKFDISRLVAAGCDERLIKLITNLMHPDHEKRPSAQIALHKLEKIIFHTQEYKPLHARFQNRAYSQWKK